MQTIILCGGKGTRLREETEFKPKPMVLIGNEPILLHIMHQYAHYGHKDFIICLGYKGDMIKDYFLTLSRYGEDMRFDMATGNIETLSQKTLHNYQVTFAETGLETQTAGRAKQALKYIKDNHFLITYGDGVSNIDINELIDYHMKQERDWGALATISAVHPSSKYGKILFDEKGAITQFDEKPNLTDYINGGFMVFSKKAATYLRDDEMLFHTLMRLTKDRKLARFTHDGFWHCMDTMKDVKSLNGLWEKDRPWAVWEKGPSQKVETKSVTIFEKKTQLQINEKLNFKPTQETLEEIPTDQKEFFAGKKVLVTGHTGFKGAWLAQILTQWGAQVVGVSLEPETNPNLFEILNLENKITNYFVDIRNIDTLSQIFEKEQPEIVFHLAAQALVREGYDKPHKTYTSNALGTTNILEVIRQSPFVKSTVIITTDKVYENKESIYPYREIDPLGGYDPYSASKAAADIITSSYIKSFFNPKDFGKKHQTLVAIARAGNVIGGGDWAKDRLIPDIIRALFEGGSQLTIRSPKAIRPWQHVLEPLSGYLLLAQKLYNQETKVSGSWNFGPNSESFITVEELLEHATRIFEKCAYTIQPDQSKHETTLLKLDITKAETLLDWHPKMDVTKTLDETFTWYKNYYQNPQNIEEYTKGQINQFFSGEKPKTSASLNEILIETYKKRFPKKSFVPGQTGVPVSGKLFDEQEILKMTEAVLDGWWTEGRFTKEFEEKIAKLTNMKYANMVNSGSSANLVALTALTSNLMGDRKLQRGDEIITVAAGFPTTVNPILQNGCVPVFVDVELETMSIDCNQLERALSEKTKAVMIAHTLGNPFDLNRVKEFCERYNLWLIEDNCDALGSLYYGRPTGSFGDISTLSFYPAHHITTGEGGAVMTNDPRINRAIRSIRDWGRDCWCGTGQDATCNMRYSWQLGNLPKGYDHKYIYSHLGYNLKSTDLQAACGLAQIEKLPEFTRKRRENYGILREKLGKLSHFFKFVDPTPGSMPSWFGFLITLREDCPFTRQELIVHLNQRKIGTRLLFSGNITKQPYFTDYDVPYRVVGNLQNTDRVMNNTFWIGVCPSITREMLDWVELSINQFLQNKL